MKTIKTDVTIRGPFTHGRTGEPHYEAALPEDSPARIPPFMSTCAGGPTPAGAIHALGEKYPWHTEDGEPARLEFVGPVADAIYLAIYTCPDCGKDERKGPQPHLFCCEATEEGRAGLAWRAEEEAEKRLADAAPDLLHALKWAAEYVSLYTGDGAGWTGVMQGHDRERFIDDATGDLDAEGLRAFLSETINKAEEG